MARPEGDRPPMRALARVVILCLLGLGGWVVTSAVAAPHAFACAIAPGTNTCAPDVLTVSPSSTLVASKNSSITATDPSSGDSIVANYTENVYRDPTNSYCPNCLDWVVKVTNTAASTDSVERITVSNFAGFKTDIGLDSNGAPGLTNDGTISPNNVERNSSGAILAWDFNSNTSPNSIGPGQGSVLLEIVTNSSTTKPGTISVQDGVAGSGPAFGPAIPEVPLVPALGLVGGVAIGGVAWRRRRAEPQP